MFFAYSDLSRSGAKWGDLSAAEKEPFAKQAADDVLRWEEETATYDAEVEEIHRAEEALVAAASAEEHRAEKSGARKRLKAQQKQHANKKRAKAAAGKKKAPKKLSAQEKARTQSNETTAAAAKKKKARRAAFLWGNRSKLLPFLDPAKSAGILRRLESSQASCKPGALAKITDAQLIDAVNGGSLRSYQQDAVRWLVGMFDNGLDCILGDEMGLGKTLQTIAFLRTLKNARDTPGPHLIVCPLSVLSSWELEFGKWAPDLILHKIHGSNAQANWAKKVAHVGTYDCVLTTYDTIIAASCAGLFPRIKWRCLVLDEAQVIKNETTFISKGLRKLHAQCSLLLTGTPLQNNLHELWAILNFMPCLRDVFPESTQFEDEVTSRASLFADEGETVVEQTYVTWEEHLRQFIAERSPGGAKEMEGVGQNYMSHNKAAAVTYKKKPASKTGPSKRALLKAHEMLRIFMLRRTKEVVEQGIPPKKEIQVDAPMTQMQRKYYKSLLSDNVSLLSAASDNPQAAGLAKNLQGLMIQLRKVCNHPFLFPDAEDDPGNADAQKLVTPSGKMVVLQQLLKALFVKGHRVVLFSSFTSMLDIIEDFLNLSDIKYLRLDGSHSRVERKVNMHLFNEEDSQYVRILPFGLSVPAVRVQQQGAC